MAIETSTNVLSSDPIEGVLGGLPVAEQTQDFFLVFQQTGGTSPEIIDQTAYFITYLVYSDGTVSKPAEDTVALNNLIQNFPVGERVNIRLDQGTALNSGLGGLKQLTAIGTQQPIITTQTGFNTSSFDSSSLVFIGQEDPIEIVTSTNLASYLFTAIKTSNTSVTAGALTGYNVEFGLGGTVLNSGNGTLTITPNDELDLINLKAQLKISNTFDFPRNIQYSIQLNRTGTWQTIRTGNFQVPGGAVDESYQIFKEVSGEDLTTGAQDPKFRIFIGSTDGFLTITNARLEIYNQSPPAGVLEFSVTSSGQIWNTGSAEGGKQWLTGSEFLSQNYGKTQRYSTIQPIQENNAYNMSPIETPFSLRIGDRIRFEYNKFKDYIIYDLITPDEANDGLLKLRVNKDIPDNIIMNNFILHRTNIKDPAYVIINATKNEDATNPDTDTQNFSGLILPQFPSERLINNLDNIIVNLKERGIIVDNLN